MRKLRNLAVVLLLAVSGNLTAQSNDPVIMTVNGNPVTKSEFEAIFKKNNKDTEITQQSLDDYMKLFINFKLKVADAEANGLDTLQKFKEELDQYRKQLARPYLVDNELNDELVKEAYDRLKYEVRASHILIRVDWDADPKDSLRAYNHALDLRNQIVKGASFEKVATMKNGSEDPSVQKNKGDIGWFTAFQMVYPFESAAYKMDVGDVSMPVRTRYGYHIIKLTGKRPARGTIHVAHILVGAKAEESEEVKEKARKKADEIYERIKKGEDFATLAQQFSDDPSSARKGGELPPFGTGKMVDAFEDAAFALEKDGDISPVIQTAYGFHIIKRLDLSTLEPFEKIQNNLKQRVQRDTRSHLPRQAFITKLKTKYNFKEYPATLKPFYAIVDTNIFYGNWNKDKAKGLDAIMFEFAGLKFSQQGFVNFLAKTQHRQQEEPLTTFINNAFNRWSNNVLLEYEDSKLEENYPDFRLLMKEYHDGILLFELTDQKVWSKAVKDTAGLEAFYALHKNNYLWPKRYDVQIYYCANPVIAKSLKKDIKKKMTDAALLEKYNKESQLNLKIVSGKLTPADSDVLSKYTPEKAGMSKDIAENGQIVIIKTNAILEPMPKTIAEARGVITSDYQNFLEQNWLEELHKKYKVEINKDVLYSIK